MLNSDLERDTHYNYLVARSKSPKERQQNVTELSLERSISMPIFTEATALAMRLTDSPLAILTTLSGAGSQISSIAGVERLKHLSANANLNYELSGLDYCHAQTIGSEGEFLVRNFQDYPQLSRSSIYCVHQIRSYLGVPIITAAGDRLGTLSILDLVPRQFSAREIDVLRLVSRLVASEFERKILSQAQLNRWIGDLQQPAIKGFDDLEAVSEYDGTARNYAPLSLDPQIDRASPANPHQDLAVSKSNHQLDYLQLQSEIQFKLLTHLAQELRTPLTSVLGMASVLQQEIYGSLSSKQKDYLRIIYHSGQQLVTIVNEISQLGGFDRHHHKLTLKSVDLEMLCQLALQSLESIAQKKNQQIILDLSGDRTSSDDCNKRIWLLDKDKVRQIIYYLSLSLIHATDLNHQISIQLVNLQDGLQLQIVTSDPQVLLGNLQIIADLETIATANDRDTTSQQEERNYAIDSNIGRDLRIQLGLSLSQTLAIAHGGKIEAIANGLGYQLSLPLIVADRG